MHLSPSISDNLLLCLGAQELKTNAHTNIWSNDVDIDFRVETEIWLLDLCSVSFEKYWELVTMHGPVTCHLRFVANLWQLSFKYIAEILMM